MPGADASANDALMPPTSYLNMAMAPDCSSDASKPMQAWLGQLPPGSTVDLGGGCYQIDRGIRLSFPQGLTIENGTLQDLNATRPVNKGHGTPRGQPVFDVLGGYDVSFENLTFVGVDRHGYDAHLAFQAAIELEGTIGASMSGLTISHVFGDGINLEPLRGGFDHRSGHIINPTESVIISDVTIRGAGRQGITLASVNGVTISGVTMSNIAMDAFDFEADQNNEGAKNVVINGCSFSQLLNIAMQGPETGPITIENCTMPEADSGWAVNVKNTKGKADSGPIVFDHDVFNCGASLYVACFELNGATNLMVENSTATIGYPHDQIHEDAYYAINNTVASFVNDTVTGYGTLGTISANSSVWLGGGSWAPSHFGPTTTTLSQSTDTVTYGSENADSFTVAVTGQKAPSPTGTVTVADTATQSPICIATLVPGPGSLSTGTCQATAEEFDGGTAFTDLAATYFGDSNYSDSLSAPPQSFTVAPGPTTTSLTDANGTVAYGSESADSFSATVAGQSGGSAPSGTVTVTDAATASLICSAVLVSGSGDTSTATCSPTDTEFPAGTVLSTVIATYEGDTNDAGSVSTTPTDFTVGPGATSTTLDQSTDTVAYGSESADSFTVTVTGQPGMAPTGTISVDDAATVSPICTATLAANPDDSATATCRPTDEQFPSGTVFTSVIATYEGDGNDAGSVSAIDETLTVTDSP
jgi:hypothetical protein